MSFTSALPTNLPKFSYVVVGITISTSDSATGIEAVSLSITTKDLGSGSELVSSRLAGVADSSTGVETPVVGVVTKDAGLSVEVVTGRLATLMDFATGLDRSLPISVVELLFKSFGECVDSLRYVVEGMPIDSKDWDAIACCLRLAKDAIDKYRYKHGIAIDVTDPLIDELDAILTKIRYVRTGDIVEPEDHNLKVDALRKIRDILDRMEKTIELLKAWTWALGIGLEYTVAPTIKLFYVLGLAYDIDFTTGKTKQYEKLLSLEFVVAPTIKLFYKTGTINYMDCNLYNQTPYSEVILEKFTAS